MIHHRTVLRILTYLKYVPVLALRSAAADGSSLRTANRFRSL